MIRPKRYLLKVRGHELQFGDRTLIMGVLNVTPDSFSDGGRFNEPDRAVARALELEAQGADIIDIGAESTKPGAQPVSEAEELRRLIPVLKKLEGQLSIPISVDTYKSGVAAKALEYGAAFINDPSNLTIDPRLANVVAAQDAGLILNHMRGTPETWAKLSNLAHPAESVLSDLEHSVNRAQKALVDRNKIIIDPGLGFGKRGDQNWEILARLGKLRELDLPILVGASRKGFLGQKTNDAMQQDFATAAAVTGAILEGAHMVRVHKVSALVCTVQAADALLRNGPEEIREHKEKRRVVKASDRRPYGIGEASDIPGPRDVRPGWRPAAEISAGEERPLREPEADRGPVQGAPSESARGGGRPDGEQQPFIKRSLYNRPSASETGPGARREGPAAGEDRREGPPAGGDRPSKFQGGWPKGDRPRGPFERGGGEPRPFMKRPSYGARGSEDRGRGGERAGGSYSGGDRPYRKPNSGDRPPAGQGREYGGGPRGGRSYRGEGGGERDNDRPSRSWPERSNQGGDNRGDGPFRPRFGPPPSQSGDKGKPPSGPRPKGSGPGDDRPFRPRFPKPPGFRRG
jgi:dihydropteroate synthase